MADYYPLIARAVAGLERNTAEARRALYERARAALVAQLRGVVPALEESEITRERLALEESIRKVEAEAARHSRAEIPRPPPRPPRANPAPLVRSAPLPKPEPEAPPAETAPPAAPAGEPEPPPHVATEAAPDIAEPLPPPSPEPEPPPPAAPKMRSPRKREAPPVELGPVAPAPRAERKAPADRALRAPLENPPEAIDLDALARIRRPGREGRDTTLPAAHDFDQLEAPAEIPVEPERPARERPPKLEFEPSLPLPGGRPTPPRERERPRPQPADDLEEIEAPAARRSYRSMVKWVIALLILGSLAGFSFWQRSALSELYYAFVGSPSSATREASPPPVQTARPKIEDRIGPAASGPASAPQNAAPGQVAPVAQRVVLYEEEPSNPEGKRFVGNVVWRTETISPGPGLPPELAIKADIEIPELKITATWSIRRNLDKTLPASHTIEIMFNLPPDFPGGGIANVPGILMKQAEQTRGVPLAGLAVKVTTGFFLIGLSAVDSDMQRNIQLLKERPWFDIPLVYNNQRRAILALEKGVPGERAFAEAFAAWKQ
jgi:hypothetical protein